jgi:hypothetical protein
VFIFTDGTDTPAKDAHTTTNVCGWGLTIQLADPAKGTGWGKCLARRFGPVRLDPQHPAFVGAIEFDNNVAELNALIQPAGRTAQRAAGGWWCVQFRGGVVPRAVRRW